MRKFILFTVVIILGSSSLIYAQKKGTKGTNTQSNEVKKHTLTLEKIENIVIEQENSKTPVNEPEFIISTPPDTIQTDQSVKTYLKGYEFTFVGDGDYYLPKSGTKALINDHICYAIELDLDSTCLSLQQTNDHSDKDFFGGCIPNGVTSIFYKFTVADDMDMFSITMSNFLEPYGVQLYFMLLEGPCTDPTILSVDCTYTPYNAGESYTHNFYNLTPGTEYFIMIGTQPGEGNWINGFDLCFEKNIDPPL